MDNFKGIYIDDESEFKYYEGGAHFKYKDICLKLEILTKTLSPERLIKAIPNNHLTNLKIHKIMTNNMIKEKKPSLNNNNLNFLNEKFSFLFKNPEKNQIFDKFSVLKKSVERFNNEAQKLTESVKFRKIQPNQIKKSNLIRTSSTGFTNNTNLNLRVDQRKNTVKSLNNKTENSQICQNQTKTLNFGLENKTKSRNFANITGFGSFNISQASFINKTTKKESLINNNNGMLPLMKTSLGTNDLNKIFKEIKMKKQISLYKTGNYIGKSLLNHNNQNSLNLNSSKKDDLFKKIQINLKPKSQLRELKKSSIF